MANEEHLEILEQSVEAWNEWREENPDVKPDLSEADLSEANLIRANLSGAILGRADLIEAYLIRAYLGGADLIGANFGKVIFGATAVANVDLSVVKGLETVEHRGPSSIGIDTIYRSKGQIPEEFLRGAGAPEGFIEYIPSLIGQLEPIEYYSCFISYSHKDEDFAQRLHSRLRDEGLRVWFAPEDIQAGRKIHKQIEQAIRIYDKLLLILSEHSMESEWVNTEIYHARQREVEEGRRVLFPIRLVGFGKIEDWKSFDADTGRDMAREIREYYIPDFSNWKDYDTFEEGFERLLQDLRAEDSVG